MPQNIYDNPDFFHGYSQLARSQHGLAGAPEWQALRHMLPPLHGLRVLDLGCGFGAFSRWARDHGAQSVLALDLSEKMLQEARTRTPDLTNLTYQRADIETLSLPDDSFDLVYSALVLHYLPDINPTFGALCRLLVPNGTFVFSIEHPIYTAPTHPGWQTTPDGSRVWQLNGYLDESARVTDWILPGILKYHRTVATYVNGLIAHGFQILYLDEWGPTAEQRAEHPEWADEIQRPPFLLVAARRLPS